MSILSSRDDDAVAGEQRRSPRDADLHFFPALLGSVDAARLMALLSGDELIAWREDHIALFGRSVALPRLTAWHGDPGLRYMYSGIEMITQPWNAPLLEIRAHVERVSATRFNAVLLNLYRDGEDSVSWHSDDEPELGPDPVIASVSLGETRVFVLRHRQRRRNAVPNERFVLPGGSLLVMQGATQRYWQHCLPKCRARPCGARVNLSFRRIVSRSLG